jgi:cytochrome c oxidase subunit 2
VANILYIALIWLLGSGAAEWEIGNWAARNVYYYPAANTAILGQDAFVVVLRAVAPIFVFIVVMLIFSMLRFRARPGETGDAPVQARFNPAFVWSWIILSFLVNIFLWLHPTTSGLEAFWNFQRAAAADRPLVVNVEARQWEWIFSYPQYHIQQAVDNQGEDVLVLPVNRPVKFVLTSGDPFHTYDSSVDVIHSFWIPAFGIKWDVVPGETRTITLTPDRIASTKTSPLVRVQCAEDCGAGHPYMVANVNIVTASQFATWAAKQQAAGN